MTDYNSKSDDDSYNSDFWDIDEEAGSSSAPALRSPPDAPGPSMLVPQDYNSDSDDDSYNSDYWDNDGEAGPSCAPALRNPSDAPGPSRLVPQEFLQEKDDKIKILVNMGFTKDEADAAISRCGLNSYIDVLVDSITSSQIAEDGNSRETQFGGMVELKKKRMLCERDGTQGRQPSWDDSRDSLMPIPTRRLPEVATGPPYFYYEDMAILPKDTWDRISRFLYNIVPEIMDSKHFSAAARERGFIHNLPIDNRSHLLPLPPKTIFGVFPHTKPWWPSWDKRTQLHFLKTSKASPQLITRIHSLLANCDDIPPPRVQKYVVEECRKWGLVWVGKNRVAPLEPQDMEYLLGFPRDYTRGVTTTERYKSLGDSFQIDSVAYHLSVLKAMYPTGMNVLSLFSGIGGGVVALHKLGIHMKTVVSVEISHERRNIFRSWWEETQSGILIQIDDVRSLTDGRIKALVREYGDFDLVIGGNAYNSPTGSGELDHGDIDSLFYEYARILYSVRLAMGRV